MRALQSLKIVETGLSAAVDAVLPPRCVVTGGVVDRQGMIDPQVWRDLSFISDPVCDCCGFPFEFDVGPGSLCVSCLSSRPVYASARAALVYNDLSRNLILRFKYADQTHAAHAFIPWLKRVGGDMLGRADYIVPVPLHSFRLLRRRYNQAALIAQTLGKSCELPYLPQALKRQRPTPSQGKMDYKDRQKNVRNAFSVLPRYESCLQGKTIVLVDDVYTTGATVKECTKALLKAGAKEVHVLAVVRVVRAQ